VVGRNRKEYSHRGKDPIASFHGFVIEKVSGGGSKKRLKWGGKRRGDAKPPPFDILLSSVEESDYVPHTSGEARTRNSDEVRVPDILYSERVPSARDRDPLPLLDSSEVPGHKSRRKLPVLPDPAYRGHRRRDWKRRRQSQD
jgi:hypothetical protein